MDATDWIRTSTLYRTVRRHVGTSPLVVCEYNAWYRYTIQEVRPDAFRIPLRPGEAGRRVLRAIPRDARAVVMHVNVSRTAGVIADEAMLWAALRARGVTLINADASDIRKRTLHARCLELGLPSLRASRSGPAAERVVIKTDLNYGGAPEQDLARTLGTRAERFTDALGPTRVSSPQYTLSRRGDVPAAAWDDPALVIERFVENPEGVFFRTYVVGPATCVSEVWSDDDIKKLSLPTRARVNHFFWDAGGVDIAAGPSSGRATRVAALARRVAGALGVSFGALDSVMDPDGALFVVDVNKTPYWGTDVRPDIIAHLRLGLDDLVATGGRSGADKRDGCDGTASARL